jgi:hypothetical protein
MKISEQQLQILYQIAMDSVKMDIVGIFCYPMEQRLKVVNAIMNQQDGEIVDIRDDDKPTLEPQYYKEDKKREKREDYLKKAIDLLRKWRTGQKGFSGQFLLTTNTIEFLDEYDKAVIIKEDS